jgi:hypothetical protein
MYRFVMVEKLEIELPEPQDNCNKENYDKNPFKSKRFLDFVKITSGLLHAAPSTL